VPLIFDLHRRLEPRRPGNDLDAGFRAEVHDPLWFLARQWQLGEHQGEDAASPIGVSYVASQAAVDPYGGDPSMDPTLTPPEAIVESEPGDWWTMGRRLRIGLAAGPFVPGGLPAETDAGLRFVDLPPPYDRANGAYDGLACYHQRAALGLPVSLFDEVPSTEPVDLWDPAELVYTAHFTAGGGAVPLDVPRHDGGDLDWFSVDASAAVPAPAPLPDAAVVYPTRLSYPGAPNPRWWQIENARVDIGGFPPDRSHLATMLLVDLVVSHADDWFTFPIATRAGEIVTLHQVEVRDAFDDTTQLQVPSDWSLFRVSGLDPTSLVIWPTVASPLTGPTLDDVIVGVDEDANLLWAVERRAQGRELAPAELVLPEEVVPAHGQLLAGARTEYAYRPSTYVPPFWHPYVISDLGDHRRRFVQARLADLETRPPTLMPEPVSPLLYDPHAPPEGPVHQIEPATVPTAGLRLDRRYVLGRRTDATPVLWRQRRRLPLSAPPVSNLRFDVLEDQLPLG
jgi:hypothetical protein